MPAAPTGGGHRRPPVLDRLLPPSGNGPGVGLGRDPWLHRGADPAGFADLLDLAGVDELLTRRGLRTPFLRVAKDGRTLGDREFTTGGGVGASIPDQLDAATLARLFAEGSTLVLQALHRTWGPVIDLAHDLVDALGHPVQVNAYVTPPTSRGFDDHYDVHDVLVLQLAGEKAWRVRPPVVTDPLRDDPWTNHRAQVAAAAQHPPHLEETLRPGDVLHVPRGWIHSATALGGVSAHLTVGIHAWTRRHVAGWLVDAALALLDDDPRMRAALPFGRPPGDLTDTEIDDVRRALGEALAAVPSAPVRSALDEAAASSTPPRAVRPVASLVDGDASGRP